MYLSRLQINRLPGLPDRFEILAHPGVNLIIGPNGSGKSSVTRAVFHLLWPAVPGIQPCDVIADFRFQEQLWQAAQPDGLPVQWIRDGQPVPAPALPDLHVARSYRLGMLDLNLAEIGNNDQELAREIANRMDGGFDLARTEEILFKTSPQAGRNEQRKLIEAARLSHELKTQHVQLAERENSLQNLEKELETARLADDRRRQLDRIKELRRCRIDLASVESKLAGFAPGVARIRSEDPEDLAKLRQQENQHQGSLATHQTNLDQLRTRLTSLGPSSLSSDLMASLIKEYNRCLQLRDQAARTLASALGGLKTTRDSGENDKVVDRKTYNRLIELHTQVTEHRASCQTMDTQLRALLDNPPARSPWTWVFLATGTAATAAALWLWQRASDPSGLAPILGILGSACLLAGFFLLGRGPNRTRDLQIKTIQAQRATAGQEHDQTLAEISAFAEEHGLDLDNPHFLHDLKNLSLRHEAQADAGRAEGELAGHEAQVAKALAQINGQLTEAGLPAISSGAEADQRLEDLRAEELAREKLQAEIKTEEQAVANSLGNLEQTRQSVESLYIRLELNQADGDQAVADLLALQPDFKNAETAASAARQDITRLKSEIDTATHLLDPDSVKDLAPEELDRMINQEKNLAAGESGLVDEIAEIRQQVKTARTEQALASAMASEDRCRQDLIEKRDEVRQVALGRLLLGQVRQQNEAKSRPPVLKKAQELFQLFTAGAFELKVVAGPDGLSVFRARSADSGLYLDLGQLSDGTRAQLLLAVRLGFIFTAESEVHPPLFLDDSLTASDPERFATVAVSLGQAARDSGRQIFYLTASPAAAAAWQKALQDAQLATAHVIDLGLQRKLSSAAALDQLAPADPEAVPEPAGLTPEEYARALLVPHVDPWAAPSAAHLFYLLNDDLDLLHRLITAGALSVGRWENHRTQLLESGAINAEQDRQLAVRVDIWSALMEAWQVGRGRPLTMTDILSSGIVSAAMEQKVAEVLEECGHDGSQLMTALADGKVPRFQENKKKLLQEFLEQQGFFDQRETLELDELLLQVRAAVAGHLRSEAITAAALRSLVQSLTGYLDQSA